MNRRSFIFSLIAGATVGTLAGKAVEGVVDKGDTRCSLVVDDELRKLNTGLLFVIENNFEVTGWDEPCVCSDGRKCVSVPRMGIFDHEWLVTLPERVAVKYIRGPLATCNDMREFFVGIGGEIEAQVEFMKKPQCG